MNRYSDRERYFSELAETSERYYLDYLRKFKPFGDGTRVLEVGCGEGGNLLPFAQSGCEVVGVDISRGKIENAIRFFKERGAEGLFRCVDFLDDELQDGMFDIVIAKDIMEHIAPEKKVQFLRRVQLLLRPDGIAFFGFPAWQMPFGGHQQVCMSKFLSHLPWFHLLPAFLYRFILRLFKEDKSRIDELLDIKRCKCPIEKFERVIKTKNFCVLDRLFYFINPHYETKFHLKPRILWRWVGAIPWLRNFFTTTCLYMLKL